MLKYLLINYLAISIFNVKINIVKGDENKMNTNNPVLKIENDSFRIDFKLIELFDDTHEQSFQVNIEFSAINISILQKGLYFDINDYNTFLEKINSFRNGEYNLKATLKDIAGQEFIFKLSKNNYSPNKLDCNFSLKYSTNLLGEKLESEIKYSASVDQDFINIIYRKLTEFKTDNLFFT